MGNIAVIPARGGSRRIPRKNIRLFHGKPMLAYAIQVAQQSGIFDRIVVSTDDDQIARIAERYGAESLRRPPELAVDEVGTQEVFLHAVMRTDSNAALVACIYPCVPLLQRRDLTFATELLNEWQTKTAYVASVAIDPLRDIGNFYITTPKYLLSGLHIWTHWTRIYVMPRDRAIDINTPEDWALAEKMYADLQEKNRA